MKNQILGASLFLGLAMYTANAQVGIGTTNPHGSAVLDVTSTTSGFLPPRVTTSERNSIQSPEEGLIVFNTDRNALQLYRKNVGSSNNLNGWYDTRCSSDIKAVFISYPNGITLDFSDLESYGKFYSDINGGGTEFTSSTPTNTGIGSIGPFPNNIEFGTGAVYLNYLDNVNEPGDLTSNPVFTFVNIDNPNSYNASTFSSRRQNWNLLNKGDLLTTDLDVYEGDFDLFLVAKFDTIPNRGNASFFSTGDVSTGLQIGVGHNANPICTKDNFNAFFPSKNICGDTNSRIPFDTEFHRFRIKFTDNLNGNDAKVELYIDGVLIETYQGSELNSTQISRLDLFNNRARTNYGYSSIAYLGIYSDFISDEDYQKLDAYLACKFELQP